MFARHKRIGALCVDSMTRETPTTWQRGDCPGHWGGEVE